MIRDNRGAISILALGVMMFVGILLTGISYAVTAETGHNKANADLLQAQYAAEAGAKRALSVFRDGKTGAASWGWIQSNTTLMPQNLFADNTITYSVLIRQNNQSGSIVSNPGASPAPGTYYVEATGKTGNSSQKYAVTVTIDAASSLPMGMSYVLASTRTAVGQIKNLNWRRDSGKQYNADSWNGLTELILQEGSTTLVAAADLKYDGTGDRRRWGSNWHFGRPDSASYIPGTEPATYTLQNDHPQDTTYMTADGDSVNFTNLGDFNNITSDNWNTYKDLNNNLWNGTPTVYAGGSSSLNSFNNNSSMSSYFPPWVLLTSNGDFSATNIDSIIYDAGRTTAQKQTALKSVLGTIIVYGDPSGSAVQIFHINVNKTTGVITRSATNLATP